MMGNIAHNVSKILAEISASAVKSGRNSKDIKLVGVTKTLCVDTVRELIAAGVTQLGENRVQEFLPKYDPLTGLGAPTWHFIGSLQRNKVKYIIDKVAMIHSVDNLPLAQEIDMRAGKIGRVMDVLVEINIANEASKHGIPPDEALLFINTLAGLSNIRVKGLMCIAPFVENPEDNREHFNNMRNKFLDINARGAHNLTELSMGMSGDYNIAVEEGATIVRIGTALVR